MNRSQARYSNPLAAGYPPLAHNGAVIWEEMPSLARRVVPMDMSPSPSSVNNAVTPPKDVQEFNSAWGVTMPADLVAAPQVTPFREAISGLDTREVLEPEVFRHFFG